MKRIFLPLIATAIMLLNGCASLALQPADFSWPVESALKADAKGMVQEARYSLSFNVKPMLLAEQMDTSNVSGETVHVIRDKAGYYFLAVTKFKNVYIFAQGDGKLSLDHKIFIAETGMPDPKFNQRTNHIELLTGKDKLMLTRDGIVPGGQK